MLEGIIQLHNIGVRSSDDAIEKERIRFINDVCILFTLTTGLFIVLSYVISSFEMRWLASAGMLMYLVTFFLQWQRKFLFARSLIIIASSIFCTAILIFFGGSSDVGVSFLLVSVGIIIIFPNINARIILITFNLICYFFGNWYLIEYPSLLENEFGLAAKFLLYASTTAITVFVLNNFSKFNNTAEATIQSLLARLKINKDVLESKKVIIEEQNLQLIESNKELQQFMYVTSHDLKSPLRNISGFVSLLKRKLKTHPNPNIHEYLDFTVKGTAQMRQLIDDILEYSRAGQNIEIEAINLSEVLKNTQIELDELISKQKATIEAKHLPTINFDFNLMQLLFKHLIDNSIRYNENEQPTVRINYQFSNHQHQLTFEDNGIGIAKEDHLIIFEMFKRLHTQVTYQGSGIGLATCRKIMDLFKGEIFINSQIGIGTTVTIQWVENK